MPRLLLNLLFILRWGLRPPTNSESTIVRRRYLSSRLVLLEAAVTASMAASVAASKYAGLKRLLRLPLQGAAL